MRREPIEWLLSIGAGQAAWRAASIDLPQGQPYIPRAFLCGGAVRAGAGGIVIFTLRQER